MGEYRNRTFLIEPVDLPLCFTLSLAEPRPELRIHKREERCPPAHDARIAGRMRSLIDMIEGRVDGDALFFSRDIFVSGDTEAVVVLRNAIDDLGNGLIEELAYPFGRPVRTALKIIQSGRSLHEEGKKRKERKTA